MNGPLHAVIGVVHDGARTFYVRRSTAMKNYPGVWSLLSIQYDPSELPDPLDLEAARPIFKRMSVERLGGVDVTVLKHLTSSTCSDNPMDQRVILHMYELNLATAPALNPMFYDAACWMLPDEYREKSQATNCGLCLRMWSDYCVRMRLVDTPFAPTWMPDDD